MGNDGGSIPGRQEMVKQKKPQQKIRSHLIDKARANYCTLSKDPLKKPIVVCRLGNLYNKSAIVSALVEKKIPKCYGYIRSLKDVKEANVCLKAGGAVADSDDCENRIICPITQMEYNGTSRFWLIWSCGCLVSEKALKELGVQSHKCVNCGKPYSSSKHECANSVAGDLISLNWTNGEQEKRRRTLMMEQNKHMATAAVAKKTKDPHEEEKALKLDPLAGKRPQMSREELRAEKKSKSDASAAISRDVVDKIKDGILNHPDLMSTILTDHPDDGLPKDDFMTRCAHRGLH